MNNRGKKIFIMIACVVIFTIGLIVAVNADTKSSKTEVWTKNPDSADPYPIIVATNTTVLFGNDFGCDWEHYDGVDNYVKFFVNAIVEVANVEERSVNAAVFAGKHNSEDRQAFDYYMNFYGVSPGYLTYTHLSGLNTDYHLTDVTDLNALLQYDVLILDIGSFNQPLSDIPDFDQDDKTLLEDYIAGGGKVVGTARMFYSTNIWGDEMFVPKNTILYDIFGIEGVDLKTYVFDNQNLTLETNAPQTPYPVSTLAENSRGDWWVKILLPSRIEAAIDIDPNTLNLKSKGNFITCYIELPEGYDVENINIDSITLTKINGVLLDPSLYTVGPSDIKDYNNNGIHDLMVKFDRQKLISLLEIGDIELTVAGELTDGLQFEGSDTINVQ